MIFERDGNACVYCGRKCGEYQPPEISSDGRLSLDHVIPATRGGDATESNIVTCCGPCNNRKNNRTPEEAGLIWPTDVTGNRYGSVTKSLPEKRREEKSKKESPKGDSKVASLPEVAAAWNEIPGVIHIRMMTKKRQASLKSRLADPTWVDDWKDGIEKVRNSSFCRGGSDTGWQADIDWFLKPDTLTKILEGKYDDRDASPPVDDRLPYMTQAEIDAHNAAFRASKERHQHG